MVDITLGRSDLSGTASIAVPEPKGRSPEIRNRGTTALPMAPLLETSRRRLGDLCTEYHLNTTHVVGVLSAHGIRAAAGLTLRQISERNATSVHRVYDMVRLSSQS